MAPGTTAHAQGRLIASGLTLEPGAELFPCIGIEQRQQSSQHQRSGTFAGFGTNMPNLAGTPAYTATSATFTVTASDVLFQGGFEQTASDSPCVAAFLN